MFTGFYETRIAYYSWRGAEGYRFASIPDYWGVFSQCAFAAVWYCFWSRLKFCFWTIWLVYLDGSFVIQMFMYHSVQFMHEYSLANFCPARPQDADLRWFRRVSWLISFQRSSLEEVPKQLTGSIFISIK